jgi:L-lysine exporter family protein LysE/ArgO
MLSTMINGLILGFVASPTCPSNGEEIKQGTRYGFIFALTVGIGAVTGDAIVLVAVLLGLMPLIESYPLIKAGLWLIGGIILLYVSWGIFSEIRTVRGVSSNTNKTHKELNLVNILQAFCKGTAITTFNPFTVVWWIGLITPIIAANQIPTLFSFAVLIGSLIWFVILAVLLHIGRKFLTKTSLQWIIGASGIVVLGYSLYFLWQFFIGVL